MSLKIRLSRGGAKKRPFYRIVVADARMPRDGRFVEKIGTFDPVKAKDDADASVLDVEKAKAWLAKGAQPTDRVLRLLDCLGVAKREAQNNPQKALPKKKAQERAAAAAAAAEKAAAAPRLSGSVAQARPALVRRAQPSDSRDARFLPASHPPHAARNIRRAAWRARGSARQVLHAGSRAIGDLRRADRQGGPRKLSS